MQPQKRDIYGTKRYQSEYLVYDVFPEKLDSVRFPEIRKIHTRSNK